MFSTLFFFVEICRGDSFHCKNKQCIARSLHCNGIEECGDGSDEPWSCPGSINVNDILKNANIGNIYGSLFGYAAGVIILIFGIITTIGATVTICACKKSCPLYKWRKRREEPPVGVILAEPNDLYQDDTANLLSNEENTGKVCLIKLICMTVIIVPPYRSSRQSNPFEYHICQHPHLRQTCKSVCVTA